MVKEQVGTRRFEWMMIPLPTRKLLVFLDTVLLLVQYFFY